MRRNIARALLLILFPLAGKPANAVVGGELADTTLKRYTVAVRSAKGWCSGVVLAQDIVLTAAHCTRDAQNLWVGGPRGWGDQFNPPVGLNPVTATVLHPRYNPNEHGSPDLALLKLAKPLPDRFVPASLGARMPSKEDDLIATGYGESVPNDPAAGAVLRMVLLRVSVIYGGNLVLTSTREETAGAGHGDSGGPVFTYHGLHPLVGILVGHSGSKTTAVSVASYYVWIKEEMEKLGGS